MGTLFTLIVIGGIAMWLFGGRRPGYGHRGRGCVCPRLVDVADKYTDRLSLQLLGLGPSSWGWSCFAEL